MATYFGTVKYAVIHLSIYELLDTVINRQTDTSGLKAMGKTIISKCKLGRTKSSVMDNFALSRETDFLTPELVNFETPCPKLVKFGYLSMCMTLR
jgi:hypothetical protein